MVKPVTDSRQLTRLKLAGYKSIQSCDLEFGSLNVLIGANGAGKSNFIGFFRLLFRTSKDARGGIVSYGKVRTQILRKCREDHAATAKRKRGLSLVMAAL